jgi:hypothetical protein
LSEASSRDEVPPEPAEPRSEDPQAARHGWPRSLVAKVALDLFIVFAGVSAAFALENYRTAQEQHHRRDAVCGALDRELGQLAVTRGPTFQREMTTELRQWDQAISHGEKPLPPAFRLPGAERPPTGVWDAAVATNSIELIDPNLFFELARFYNRAKSAGDLYQRYSAGAQMDVWPRLQEGPQAFWTPDGRLRPEIMAHVQRLRDFRDRQAELGQEARQLRADLRASCRT